MLKAGFSRLDVTPPLGSYVAGYFHERHAKGILDPIYIHALAMSDGEGTAILFTADFLNMDDTCADSIRALVEERTGVPADHVMIACLHSHTSVTIRHNDGNSVTKDASYRDILWRKFADAAQLAMNDMREAKLLLGEQETGEPLSFIRRNWMKDGTVCSIPSREQFPLIDRPCDQSDNTVRLLRFAREEGNDIALVNFSTHPDVIGGELLSADWPGFVRRYVEADLKGVSCLLLNGVQGDANHINYIDGVVNRGYSHSDHMGRVIADTVKLLWDKSEPFETGAIKGGTTSVYDYTTTSEDEQEILRCLRRRLPVSVISLGKLAIVGIGGEPFTHYATAIREACPDRRIIAACCTNGAAGYLPTADAFSEGGYEATSSRFSATLEQDCVATAAELLGKL